MRDRRRVGFSPPSRGGAENASRRVGQACRACRPTFGTAGGPALAQGELVPPYVLLMSPFAPRKPRFFRGAKGDNPANIDSPVLRYLADRQSLDAWPAFAYLAKKLLVRFRLYHRPGTLPFVRVGTASHRTVTGFPVLHTLLVFKGLVSPLSQKGGYLRQKAVHTFGKVMRNTRLEYWRRYTHGTVLRAARKRSPAIRRPFCTGKEPSCFLRRGVCSTRSFPQWGPPGEAARAGTGGRRSPAGCASNSSKAERCSQA